MLKRFKVLFFGIIQFPLILFISLIVFLSAGPFGSLQLIIDYIFSIKDELLYSPRTTIIE